MKLLDSIPAYSGIKCPYCGEVGRISLKLGWRYWLAEETWVCPHCKESATTAQLHEASAVTERQG